MAAGVRKGPEVGQLLREVEDWWVGRDFADDRGAALEELQAALDPDLFWRAHRSYVVNVNRIREVVPWFKSTYQLKMDDKKTSEIPVSRMQSKRLREMLNL